MLIVEGNFGNYIRLKGSSKFKGKWGKFNGEVKEISNFHVSKSWIFPIVNWFILYSETTFFMDLFFFRIWTKFAANCKCSCFETSNFPYCKWNHSVLWNMFFPMCLILIPIATSLPEARNHLPGYRFRIVLLPSGTGVFLLPPLLNWFYCLPLKIDFTASP